MVVSCPRCGSPENIVAYSEKELRNSIAVVLTCRRHGVMYLKKEN